MESFDYKYLIDPDNMAEIAQYADGMGPDYNLLFDVEKSSKGHIVVNDFVRNAHNKGMIVHPYTIRKDRLPDYVVNVDELYDAVLYQADADGVFTDFPDLGVKFVESKEK